MKMLVQLNQTKSVTLVTLTGCKFCPPNRGGVTTTQSQYYAFKGNYPGIKLPSDTTCRSTCVVVSSHGDRGAIELGVRVLLYNHAN